MKGIDGFDGKSVDVDFAVGSIFATRSFNIDEEGYLTGITFGKRHLPGENIAECTTCDSYKAINRDMRELQKKMGDAGILSSHLNKLEELPEPSMAECGHGFWAYFDKKDEFGGVGSVSGVVTGYGEVIVGEKGIRSSKSRVVALLDPTKDEERNLETRQGDMKYMMLAFFVNFALMFLNLFNGFNGNPTGFAFAGFTFIVMLLLVPQAISLVRAIKVLKMVQDGEEIPDGYEFLASAYRKDLELMERFALVRKNYPDVQFFESRKEMLNAFPQLKEEKKKWRKSSNQTKRSKYLHKVKSLLHWRSH